MTAESAMRNAHVPCSASELTAQRNALGMTPVSPDLMPLVLTALCDLADAMGQMPLYPLVPVGREVP